MIIQSTKEATREELIQRIEELEEEKESYRIGWCKIGEENTELKHINEQHRILNGELREEINQLKKEKQKILDYISEE